MVVRLLTTMSSRNPDEPHRVATPLELFFDLTFVVAVAQASSTMHHLLVEGHAGEGLTAFPMVFFAIWWAWMNFTWFSSAYDQVVGHSTLTDLEAAFVLTVPVALFLLTVWVLHWRHKTPGPFRIAACPVTAAVVLATSWSGEPVLLTGLATTALVVTSLLTQPAGPTDPGTGITFEEATVP